MVQISFRTDEELQELLKLEVIRSGKTQNAVINEALLSCLKPERAALEKIKQAVVAGRAKGKPSLIESLELADKTATLDDSEGIGTIRVTRSKTSNKPSKASQ
jgi:hypothetical protein